MLSKLKFTKGERAALRRAIETAFERDLGNALIEVEAAISQWRAAKLSAFEVSEVLHHFHRGPARELFDKYRSVPEAPLVVGAIERGVLSLQELPPKLRRKHGVTPVESVAGRGAARRRQAL